MKNSVKYEFTQPWSCLRKLTSNSSNEVKMSFFYENEMKWTRVIMARLWFGTDAVYWTIMIMSAMYHRTDSVKLLLLQTFSYCNDFFKMIEWFIILKNTDFSYLLYNLHAVRRWPLVWSQLFSDMIQFQAEFASYCRTSYLPFHGRK